MSRGYRYSFIAIIGWLTLAHFASAQTPAVEGQPAQQPASKEAPIFEVFIPIKVIENSSKSEHTKAREAKTDEHDAQDLDAQVRSAQAAEKQVRIAFASVFFALLGTGLLVWNLTEARKANALTLTAIAQEQTNAQRQLRAYIGAHADYVYRFDDNRPEVRYEIRNFGQTPAMKMRNLGKVMVCPFPLPDDFQFPVIPDLSQNLARSNSVLFPNTIMNGNARLETPLNAEDLEAVLTGSQMRIYLFARIEYEEVFGSPQWTTLCLSVVGGETLRKVSQGTIVKDGEVKFQFAAKFNEAR